MPSTGSGRGLTNPARMRRSADEGCVHARAARARRRAARLPAAQGHLGLGERRADHRRRHVPAGRHAVRPRADPGDARRDGADPRRPPDRRRDEHACQRRPLLRQRAAARRHRDLRVGRGGRGDAGRHARARAPPDDHGRARPRVAGLRRGEVRGVHLLGHHPAPADADVLRAPGPLGRRPRRLPRRGRSRPHRRGHDRPRPRRRRGLQRRHPLRRGHAGRVGPRSPTGCAPATASSSSARA